MSIAHDLSSEIATAVLSTSQRNPEKLNDLKETVMKVHSILEELDNETRSFLDGRDSTYRSRPSIDHTES